MPWCGLPGPRFLHGKRFQILLAARFKRLAIQHPVHEMALREIAAVAGEIPVGPLVGQLNLRLAQPLERQT